MAVSRRSARPRFTLVILILLSLTLVTLDLKGGGPIPSLRGRVRDAFSPVQSAVSTLTSPITNFFNGVFEYQSLRDDNDRLRAELAQDNAQQIENQYLDQTNKDLISELNLDFVGDIPTIAARVVSGSTSNFQATIVIDRGTDAGVLDGMPVVAGTGLVGRITSTSPSQSTVLLLTDPSTSVGVQFAPSDGVGVASGQGAGRSLAVTLIDPTAAVGVGNAAVTSGLVGSAYPRGIPVGTVNTAVADPGVQTRTVTLTPVVDLGRLSYVDVLVWTSQMPGNVAVPATPTTTTTPGTGGVTQDQTDTPTTVTNP